MFVTLWVERGNPCCILPCWFKTSICLLFFFYTDEVIDETYGVAVQFDEEEEEVI